MSCVNSKEPNVNIHKSHAFILEKKSETKEIIIKSCNRAAQQFDVYREKRIHVLSRKNTQQFHVLSRKKKSIEKAVTVLFNNLVCYRVAHTHTLSLSNTHTHTHTHTPTHTHNWMCYRVAHTHTHTLSLSHTHTHTQFDVPSSRTHTHIHTVSLSRTHTHTHTIWCAIGSPGIWAVCTEKSPVQSCMRAMYISKKESEKKKVKTKGSNCVAQQCDVLWSARQISCIYSEKPCATINPWIC